MQGNLDTNIFMHKPWYKSSANFQKHYIKCFTRTQFNFLLALINIFVTFFVGLHKNMCLHLLVYFVFFDGI